jgi:hypothetical protein
MPQCNVINLSNCSDKLSEETHLIRGGENGLSNNCTKTIKPTLYALKVKN